MSTVPETRPHPAFVVLWLGLSMGTGIVAYCGLTDTGPYHWLAEWQVQHQSGHRPLVTGFFTWGLLALPWFLFVGALAVCGAFGNRSEALKVFERPRNESPHLVSLFLLLAGSCVAIQGRSDGDGVMAVAGYILMSLGGGWAILLLKIWSRRRTKR